MKPFNIAFYSLLFTVQLFAQGQSIANRTIRIPHSNGLNFTTYDAGINSELSEIGSGFFMNKYLVLSNKKRGFSSVSVDPETNIPNNNLFCVDFDKNGNLSHPVLFSKVLDAKTNEGTVTFSKDEKTIYLTRAKEDNSKQFSLYKASLDLAVKGFWKDIQELSINGNYSIETPFTSPDGKKLYFSSDKDGGYGGYDLYSSDIMADGTLSNVTNLGPMVNSAKDEKYPYMSGDDRYLYFSSNGHETLGGYDIFRVSHAGTAFVNRSNLGETINTSDDEIAFTYSYPGKGYFSSNRKDNKLDFDIYKFELAISEQNFEATVEESLRKIALPGTAITVKDEFGKVVKQLKSDENGNFSLKVNPLTAYSIEASKDGYELNTLIFKANGNNNQRNSIALTQLKAKVTRNAIVLENIHFDFDKATLKKESELSLDKVIEVLNTHPEMKINIGAHTDSKGQATYNMALSERRGKTVYDYLISNGITKDRLSYRGYGKSQLKYKCPGSCPEEEESQNRRVEFTIKK